MIIANTQVEQTAGILVADNVPLFLAEVAISSFRNKG